MKSRKNWNLAGRVAAGVLSFCLVLTLLPAAAFAGTNDSDAEDVLLTVSAEDDGTGSGDDGTGGGDDGAGTDDPQTCDFDELGVDVLICEPDEGIIYAGKPVVFTLTDQSEPGPMEMSVGYYEYDETTDDYVYVSLTEDDFDVTYDGNDAPGTATITVTGKGAYTGEVSGIFTILEKAEPQTYTFDELGVALQLGVPAEGITYPGSPVVFGFTDQSEPGTQEMSVGYYHYDETTDEDIYVSLTKDDFDVTYEGNDTWGTATVTVTGKGSYTGELTETFRILEPIHTFEEMGVELKVGAPASGIPYKGSAVKLTATNSSTPGTTQMFVGCKNENGAYVPLPEDAYTVSYKNNNGPGMATVTVTGTGQYSGTLSKQFKIIQKFEDLGSGVKLILGLPDEIEYEGKAITFAVTTNSDPADYKMFVGYLSNGKYLALPSGSYKVSYKGNDKDGTATVTVTGTGYYVGTVSGKFTIVKASPKVQVIAGGKVVGKYKIDNTGKTDASYALNEALELARKKGTASAQVTVKVPAGTYKIANQIYVYSNTCFDANAKAVFVHKKDAGAMIKCAHMHDGVRCRAEDPGVSTSEKKECKTGGYNQVKNVTIRGGRWDVNCQNNTSKNAQAVLIRHGQNIKIENLIIEHATNHGMNVSGCKNVTIKNCTFRNTVKYTGKEKSFWGKEYSKLTAQEKKERFRSLEELHLDFVNADSSEGAWPQDGTICENITVDGCTFSKVFAGVGTHHKSAKRAKNITVKNCTFKTIRSGSSNEEYGPAVYYMSADGITVSKCTADNVRSLILLDDCTGLKASNCTVTNSKENGILLLGSKGTISKCKIKGGIVGNGVAIKTGTNVSKKTLNSSVKLTGNTISGAGVNGIYAEKNATVTVTGGTVSASKKIAIRGDQCKMVIKNVKIPNNKDKETGAIYLTNGKSGSLVSGCTVTNSLARGISVADSAKTTIKNNTVTNSRNNGIQVKATAKNCTAIVTGNTSVSKYMNGKTLKYDYLFEQGSKKCKKCSVTKNKYGTGGFGGNASSLVTRSGNTSKYAVVTGIADKKYKGGAAVTQKPKVVINDKANKIKIPADSIRKGNSYKLSYKNNKKVGTAIVYLKEAKVGSSARNRFPIVYTKTFKIKK